jgi:hypothetical protein
LKLADHIITYHSVAIEGCTLTEDETRLLFDENILPGGKPIGHVVSTPNFRQSLLEFNHF